MRRQPPVHSPLSLGAIMAGARAALRGDPAGGTRERVLAALAERYDASDVLLADSGTSALRLAIEGARAIEPRPVALPGYTCYDVSSAAEGAGADILLYDVDPRTLAPDPDSLASAVRQGAGAVVVTHLFGQLVDLAAVAGAIGDALLVEDAAQGVGGRIGGRPLGSFGSLSTLSFSRGKGLTAGGGGAVLAHDERGRRALEWVRRHVRLAEGGRGHARVGALAAQWTLGRPSLYGIPSRLPFLHLGVTRYHPPRPPGDIPTACVAVLLRNLGGADREAATWRRNAERLGRALAGSERLEALVAPAGDALPGYLRLPALARGARPELLDAEAAALGVAAGYPTTLAALPSLASRLAAPRPPLPGSERLAGSLVTLPTHGFLGERDLARLERWILRAPRR